MLTSTPIISPASAPQLRVFRTGQKLRVQVSLAPSSPAGLHLYNVRSDAPFPAAVYSETEREARTDLDLWLATTRFVGFDIADALAARFDYPFLPEKALSIAGTALTPDRRILSWED